MTKETRIFNGGFKVERRDDSDGGSETVSLSGYGAVFNELSEDFGGWQERIEPGAFARVLGDDVRALLNHDSNFILGRTTAGTLSIEEDERGLKYTVDLPDTQAARDLVVSIERGDISQSSFAFNTDSVRWEQRDGVDIRVIEKMSRLYDVSPVVYPAYPQTDVGLRSLEHYKENKSAKRRFEKFKRATKARLELARF